MAKLYYTPREAAEMLAISDDAVLDLVKRGEILPFAFHHGSPASRSSRSTAGARLSPPPATSLDRACTATCGDRR